MGRELRPRVHPDRRRSAPDQDQLRAAARLGYLSPTVRNIEESTTLRAFVEAMSNLGYVENRNWIFEQRYADDYDPVPSG